LTIDQVFFELMAQLEVQFVEQIFLGGERLYDLVAPSTGSKVSSIVTAPSLLPGGMVTAKIRQVDQVRLLTETIFSRQ